jgi:acyl-homoserine-lactone acylase
MKTIKNFLKIILLILFLPVNVIIAQHREDIRNWERLSERVTIVRDNWGVPHIYGRSDNDAVFGLMYAQCEDGNIAYWHGNAIPKRSTKFNWRNPVDGSNPETEWDGIHSLDEIIHSINPPSGWLQNCNSTPFICAGAFSPDSSDYPNYMSYDPQTYRARDAIKFLTGKGKISFEQFEYGVVSTHLTMMENWLPQIIKAYDEILLTSEDGSGKFQNVIDTLKKWNYKADINCYATTIAVTWNNIALNWARQQDNLTEPAALGKYLNSEKLPYSDSLSLFFLSVAIDTLYNKYGKIFVKWGEINRLQRIHTSGIIEEFDDSKPSLAVKGAPGFMGSLFSFITPSILPQFALSPNSTNKNYGIGGNTYVAVVEFGRRIKARSVMYFGQSADPTSPHYFDQAPLYAQGKFKDVYFYRKDVLKHAKEVYNPGREKPRAPWMMSKPLSGIF